MSSNHTLNPNGAGDTEHNSEKVFVVVNPKEHVLLLQPKPAILPKTRKIIFPKSFFVMALLANALMSGVAGCLLTAQYINNYLNLEATHRQANRMLQSTDNAKNKIDSARLGTKMADSGLSSIAENNEIALASEGLSVVEEEVSEPLRQAFRSWLDATNKCDINRQMSFYNSRINAFYRERGVSQKVVRDEKIRVFGKASIININADEPAIIISPDGSEATMRFRKSYIIEGNIINRNGEVVQELRWQRIKNSWLIVSERDLLVMR